MITVSVSNNDIGKSILVSSWDDGHIYTFSPEQCKIVGFSPSGKFVKLKKKDGSSFWYLLCLIVIDEIL